MASNPWSTPTSAHPDSPSDNRSFPPLGTAGPSKSQRRARALYSDLAHFEPYPPRLDQLTRQELTRLELEYGEAAHQDEIHSDEEGAVPQPGYAQRSGISSVTIYDEEGNRLSRGPDIYRRVQPAKNRRGRDEQMGKLKGEGGPTMQRQSAASIPAHTPLPSAFTETKLDALVRECQRRERVQAIEMRAQPASMLREDAYEPMKEEVLRAFSSLDGFLAAFGKESVGEDV